MQDIIINFLKCVFLLVKDFQTILVGVIAAVIAVRFEHKKTYLEDQSFRRDIFFKYNEKYNDLNDALEVLLKIELEDDTIQRFYGGKPLYQVWEQYTDDPKNEDKVKKVFDYINLCSEEFYWYKKGFIEEDVWVCWKKGMQKWHEELLLMQVIVERERNKKSVYYNNDFLDIFDATVVKKNFQSTE